MKSTIIEGVEYKLTAIEKENKTVALFILTMPKNNSVDILGCAMR